MVIYGVIPLLRTLVSKLDHNDCFYCHQITAADIYQAFLQAAAVLRGLPTSAYLILQYCEVGSIILILQRRKLKLKEVK
jgi:hypothetical protein